MTFIKMTSLTIAVLLLVALIPEIQATALRNYFEETGVIIPSLGKVTVINGSLTLEDSHWYKITGLRSGTKLTVIVKLAGISSTLSTVSLHSADHIELAKKDEILEGGLVKKVKLEYVLGYKPDGNNRTIYLKFEKTRGAFNYSTEILINSVSDLYPTNPIGDSGNDINSAFAAPMIAANRASQWSGYLSSRGNGEDYEDCYRLQAFLTDNDRLHVVIEPSEELTLEAWLLSSDSFPLKSNKSIKHGEPFSITITGDWENKLYTFYLKVDNFGGVGGEGNYVIKAWIEKAQTSTKTSAPASPSINFITTLTTFTVIILAITWILVLIFRKYTYRIRSAK